MHKDPPQPFVLPEFNARSPPGDDTLIKTAAHLIDFNADNNPDYLFCLQAEKPLNDVKDPPLLRVTHKSFRDMVLSCQSWLQDHISELQLPQQNNKSSIFRGAPIALLLDSDVGLLVHFFACLGLGVPALVLSTRLSPPAIRALLNQTRSCAILASPRQLGAAKEALAPTAAEGERPTIYIQAPYRTFTKPSSPGSSGLRDTSSDDVDTANGYRRTLQDSWYNDKRATQSYISPKVATANHYVTDTDRNVLILHSSGTTGLPKAIPQAHRYLMSFAPLSSFESDDPKILIEEQGVAFSTLPLYHNFGLVAPMMSLSIGKPFAIPPPGFIPVAASTVQFMSMVSARSLFIVPSILQDITELPENRGIDALRPLRYIACGGGALSNAIGDKLVAEGIKLINGFGGTEVGSLGVLQPPGPDNDWRYFRLRQDHDCKIKEIAPIRPGESTRYVISVHPPGWTEDFEISDYFVTSPKNPGRDFRPTERADDVLVLKTGEKVQPYVLETMLLDRMDVRAALAFGNGQFEVGVMIEPARSIHLHQIEEYKSMIWPTIVEAGKNMDAHARVSSREAIIVLNSDQAFPRSAKGSVLRKAAYEVFRDEIDVVYARLEYPMDSKIMRKPVQSNGTTPSIDKAPSVNGINKVNGTSGTNGCTTSPVTQEQIGYMVKNVADHLWQPDDKIDVLVATSPNSSNQGLLSGDSEEKLLEYIRRNIWKSHAGPLNKTDDLFELGMDSLQAVQLRRFLVAEVSKSNHPQMATLDIPKDFLYTHSSIAKIAAYLRDQPRPSSTSESHMHGDTFQALMDQYVSPPHTPPPKEPSIGSTVLLTGGTGALGCHLLAQLASTTTVDRIICLNRPSRYHNNPYGRQFKENKIKGAHVPLSMIDKVEILETNTALPLLGLAKQVYWGIAASVTHIIHNAWPVDFKRTVASFESQLKIMSSLIGLTRDAGSTPRFMFVSSIAVVAKYTSDGEASGEHPIVVPETPFQPHWSAPTMGYGQAKLVCEKMIERAVTDGIVDGVIVRCGQISGAVSNGYWNPSEYFPTLVRNSVRVGALPELEGTLSWLSLETAASTLIDLLHAPSKQFLYHVENPTRQSWNTILTPLSKTLGISTTSYQDWLNRVGKLEGDATTLHDFFEKDFRNLGTGRLYLDTGGAKRDSASLGETGVVGESVARKYAARCVGS